jgi:Rieske Fe-S protein
MTETAPSRRTFLVGAAALSGAGLLVACGGPAPESQPRPTAREGSLVALADIPVGGAVSATTFDGDPILVARPTADEVVAFSAICTHQGCTVVPNGKELRCPCHGSVYQVTTGDNVSGPAPKPLEPFAVTVQDGQVVQA